MIHEQIEGTPKAQPRARVANGRKGVYTPSSAKSWKQSITLKFMKYRASFPKGEAVGIRMTFFFKRPESHYKKDGSLTKRAYTEHVQKPDYDNLEKAVVDAISNAGLWHDDCQVIESHTKKRWHVNFEGVIVDIFKPKKDEI